MIKLAGGTPITTGDPAVFEHPAREARRRPTPRSSSSATPPTGRPPRSSPSAPGLGHDDGGEDRGDPAGRRRRHQPARAAARRGPRSRWPSRSTPSWRARSRPPLPADDAGRVAGAVDLLTAVATRTDVLGAPLAHPGWLERARSRPGAARRRQRRRARRRARPRRSGSGRSRSPRATRSRSSPIACSGSTSAGRGRRRPRRSSSTCGCRGSSSAMIVGLGLAVAGATFQGILRNPLADPYVLGTASGAALGAAIAVLIPIRIASSSSSGSSRSLAFVGALLAVRGRLPVQPDRDARPADEPAPDRLRGRLAAGRRAGDDDVPVGHEPAPDLLLPARRVRGRVVARSWPLTTPIILARDRSRSCLRARSLNGFLLGEEAAAHLGVDVRRERGDPARPGQPRSRPRRSSISRAHRVRRARRAARRPARRRPERAAASCRCRRSSGRACWPARTSSRGSLGGIPVGVVTAVIGAPFFLVLLRRARVGYEL